MKACEIVAVDVVDAANNMRSVSMVRLIFACIVAMGVQYGWALQYSLLTPYVQTLGISHALSSLLWLCGPIAGIIVQPSIGLWSDRCHSRMGKRRPFIIAGCLLICIAVTLIGFSSDIGYALGDTKVHCSIYHGSRWHATIIYVLGFWLLDFSNNAVQGPARALIADLSGEHGFSAANAIYTSWIALGNILGYSTGASVKWYKLFPSLLSNACCGECANLKGAFLVSVVFLHICLTVTVIVAKEVPLSSSAQNSENITDHQQDGNEGLSGVVKSLKNLPPGMFSVLLVTSLTWLAWFPFVLYDTDWMGREIYHGDPTGTPAQVNAYNDGVRKGAFGLLLNSIILGVSSFLIEPMCRKVTARVVWVISNFSICVGMAATVTLSTWSAKEYRRPVQQEITANGGVKAAALVVFAALGFPLAILYSVPIAVVSQLVANEGGGQGLCIGVLNISIVVAQVIVALGAGPWDSLFGKGNNPAFGLASGIAILCGFLGLIMLPKFSRS